MKEETAKRPLPPAGSTRAGNSCFDRCQLKQWNGASIWNGNLQGPQCIRGYSLLLIGARDDVDQYIPSRNCVTLMPDTTADND
jgi:hypothetical protein